MPHHIVYRLACNCPRYNESMIPQTIRQHLHDEYPEHRVISAHSLGFWTLSQDPKDVFAEAVQYLLAKQQEVAQIDREEREHLFGQFANIKQLGWDPVEFDLKFETKEDEAQYLRYYGIYLNDAAASYRSMVEHVVLEPHEVVPEAESNLLDRAVRFIRNPEHYRAQITATYNPKVAMDVQRDLATVLELAKQRLQPNGYRETDYFVDRMGKALFDLEHYFPVEFDNL